MTRELKARARALGAHLVGVTRVKPDYVYAGHEVPYHYAISIGVAMNRERMKNVPDDESAGEVMRVYAHRRDFLDALGRDPPHGLTRPRLWKSQ